jgi:3-oxoacyl-[acyl-carrier protein] reductase
MISNHTDLKVLITGHSRGIGAKLYKGYSEAGSNVIGISKGNVDLSSANQVQDWLDKNSENIPDIIVMNAGINEVVPFSELNDKQLNKVLNTNFNSHLNIARYFLPRMMERKFGRFLFVSSAYAEKSKYGRFAYSLSKNSLETLSKYIALEYSEFGIMSNVIRPGFVNTELTTNNNSKKQISDIVERIPLARLAEPSELLDICLLLTSPKNTYITGQIINIDGGVSLV